MTGVQTCALPIFKGFYHLIGYTLPPVEIILALFLLIPFFAERPRMRKWGLLGSAILMTIFALYVGYMLEFRTDRPCTCGGIISQMNWHQHLYFNSVFSLLAWVAVWLNYKQFKQDREKVMFA